MKAPFCPICKAEHWTREPHRFEAGIKAAMLACAKPAVKAPRAIPIVPPIKKAIPLADRLTERRRLKRNAYQRKYLKKYRARARKKLWAAHVAAQKASSARPER